MSWLQHSQRNGEIDAVEGVALEIRRVGARAASQPHLLYRFFSFVETFVDAIVDFFAGFLISWMERTCYIVMVRAWLILQTTISMDERLKILG